MSAKDPLAYKESDNSLADIEDPRDASTVQPWNPDGDKRPGTPPVGGKDGERGTYAFGGTGLFKAEKDSEEHGGGVIPADVRPDTHYPLHGVDYWEGSTPTGNHSGVAPGDVEE